MELSAQQRPDEGLVDYRRRYRGLIGVNSKVPIRDRAILSLVYTPGVAQVGFTRRAVNLRTIAR